MEQTGRQGLIPIQSNSGVLGRLITILLLSPAWITDSCFIVTTFNCVDCFPHLLHQIYNKNVKDQKYKQKNHCIADVNKLTTANI